MSKNYLSCQLNLAVSAVRQNRLTPSKAAREYQVPRQTIVDHARLPSLTTRRGPCRELTEEEEDGLANFIIYMSNQGFPLTRHMIRAYIQEMYEQSGKESKFNLERGPSNKWFRNFGDRHPELSERVPEQQDKSSNGPIIDRFFDFFSSLVEEHELTDKPDQHQHTYKLQHNVNNNHIKEKFSKLAVHLGFGNQTLVVGKAKFPIVLNYALDQITPSSIKESFRMAGIYPIDRNALDNTQIVEEMFTSTPVQGETGHELPTTCESCGQYVGENPLVRRGLIPQSMANVFKPPTSKPAADKTKKKRVVTEGRVISGDEMLRLLKEKEEMALKKKEDVEKRKSDMVEKKIQKQKEEEERRQNRQKEKEERQLKRKRIEEEKAEKRQKKASEKIHRMDEREEMNRAIAAYQYVCGVCGEHGRTSDEARGIMWYGCDSKECGRWFHGMCLCEREREIALRSLSVSECDWWCRQCSPWMYEE